MVNAYIYIYMNICTNIYTYMYLYKKDIAHFY